MSRSIPPPTARWRAVFENADELLTDGQTVRVIVEGNEPAR